MQEDSESLFGGEVSPEMQSGESFEEFKESLKETTECIESLPLETFSSAACFLQPTSNGASGFQCPVACCSIVHVYRNERQDILIRQLIETAWPVEETCYATLRGVERDLTRIGFIDVLFDGGYTTKNEPTHTQTSAMDVDADILSEKQLAPIKASSSLSPVLYDLIQNYIPILTDAVERVPSLLKLRICRAALLWCLGKFEESLSDIFAVYKKQPLALKTNHFMHTKFTPASNIPVCFANISNTPTHTAQNININDTNTTLKRNIFNLHDLECAVCLTTLHEPVTKPCGHTSCKECILTTAKTNPKCPMCRTTLPSYSYLSKRNPNVVLSQVIASKFPDANSHKEMKINSGTERIPIFVCSLAFPGCSYGFHLFEPRYRVSPILSLTNNVDNGETVYGDKQTIWNLPSKTNPRYLLHPIYRLWHTRRNCQM